MSRWWLLVLLILSLLIASFVIWGDELDYLGDWGMKEHRNWAWAIGIGLLCADVILPIPGTVVMAAFGSVYGWFFGGCLAAVGCFIAGMTGYLACRYGGRGVALRIAGEESLDRAEQWFAGGSAMFLVAISRCIPLASESVACIAGLTQMPLHNYLFALAAGSVPIGFAFAALGTLSLTTGFFGMIILLVVFVPLFLYGVSTGWIKRP